MLALVGTLALSSPKGVLQPASAAAAASLVQHQPSCNATVSYLFLINDIVDLHDVWREYFDTCPEGSYTVHLHSQHQTSAEEHAQLLGTNVSVISQPVQGELRYRYAMQEAMHKLWRAGLQQPTANGCTPQWLQLVSSQDAPLRTCSFVHNYLNGFPGSSKLEAMPCTWSVSDCFDRWPQNWRNPRDPDLFLKASQWSTLWAADARLLLEHEQDYLAIWNDSFVPDEHYTPNVLNALGADFSFHGLTHVSGFVLPEGHAIEIDCSPDNTISFWGLPASYNNGSSPAVKSLARFDRLVRDASRDGHVYARKFGKGCINRLLTWLRTREASMA